MSVSGDGAWHTDTKGEEVMAARRILHLGRDDSLKRARSRPARVRLLVALPAVAAAAAAAYSSAAPPAPPPPSAVSAALTAAVSTSQTTMLKTAKIGGVTVLTNAKGFTLYWFAPDTPTRSACNGSCAQYWPPVPGHATAGPGVTGTLGTITRSDGSSQATYNGHPLYTYVSDSSPGQANGNDLNLNGGLWHEVTVAG
jgi:predicted lipoprotein with Yx(FWY)xxD motif